MDLDVLADAIDRLSASDPSTCADTESIEVLHRQLARFDAFVTEATAAFDASGGWIPDGARNSASWLVARCRIPRSRARRMVSRGRELRRLPASSRAWAAGDITADHVDAIRSVSGNATEGALARDEEMLVDQASALRYDSFIRAIAYWKQLADPDGVEEDERIRRSGRDVYLASSFHGMWLGKITLDPVSGSIVAGELERLERVMFEADWSEARTALGRDPLAAELPRSSGQRRADALVEMATRSQTAPSHGRRPAPLFSVLVGYETLHGRICELAGGTSIAPGSLLPWLDEAYIERAVFEPGRRVEVSATARLFTGASRRAIELRDGECSHPYCDVPARSCQADHIMPYALGGATTEGNGRLLCGFHNRLRNQRPPPGG
jgi:hypothetical protein